MSPDLVFDDGFLSRNSSSCAPGGATLLKVGLGMYSLILFLIAIFVRPLISTNLMSPPASAGRYRVKASVFSYMWLSASNTGKLSFRDTRASSLAWRGRASAASDQHDHHQTSRIAVVGLVGEAILVVFFGVSVRIEM